MRYFFHLEDGACIRDPKGEEFPDDAAAGAAMRESVIQVHVDRIDDQNLKDEIRAALAKVLAEVRRAVEDWCAILGRVTGLIADLKDSPPPLPVEEIAESVQFLQWLMEDNFTFLGVRDYSFSQDGTVFTPNLESSLGILRGREGIASIKIAVADKFECIAVERVRAGLRNDIDYRTGMDAVTGGHAVRLYA